MTNRRSMTIPWAIAALALWIWLARDLLTIFICAVLTVPYTIYLIRTFRRGIPSDMSM